MIEITCTSCQKVLNIDDAFAGGVCRCQYCGTIQTVPARNSTKKPIPGATKAAKTLFESNKSRGTVAGETGSGLDDLGDIVASSGLGASRLRRSPPPPAGKNLMPVLGLAAGIILLLLVVVLILVVRGGSGSKAAAPTTDANPIPVANPVQNRPSTPNFCGVPIDQPIVVYVIDNGSSSENVLDAIKEALFKSIDSLGPDRRFQILFWNPNTDSYPTGTETTFAVKDNLDIAKSKLQDVTASGATEPVTALKTAFADGAGQIFLITAKAGSLNDSLISKVMDARGASPARIDCIAINGVPGDSVLSKIAVQTGGTFLPLPEGQLKSLGY